MKDELRQFWTSFKTWYERDLLYSGYLRNKYILENRKEFYINWEDVYPYTLGISYPQTLEKDEPTESEIKDLIKITYLSIIKSHKKEEFEEFINDKLNFFMLNIKFLDGIFKDNVYYTSMQSSKDIISTKYLEAKISYAQSLIVNQEFENKKNGLDTLIDILEYLISLYPNKPGSKKIEETALSISQNKDSKLYNVILTELKEIMKISNEYFDIRHYSILNNAQQKREILTNPNFVEYLFSRVFSLICLINSDISSIGNENIRIQNHVFFNSSSIQPLNETFINN